MFNKKRIISSFLLQDQLGLETRFHGHISFLFENLLSGNLSEFVSIDQNMAILLTYLLTKFNKRLSLPTFGAWSICVSMGVSIYPLLYRRNSFSFTGQLQETNELKNATWYARTHSSLRSSECLCAPLLRAFQPEVY